MSRVAVTACPDYQNPALERAVRRAVDHCGGMASFVLPGQRVLLKPNLLGAYALERRVTTDPAVVLAVGRLVAEAGGGIIIGDSPAIDGFRRTVAKSGMDRVAAELDAELVELGDPQEVPTPLGCLYRRLELARQAVEADVIINLPKLKTHCMMLLTLGVKNLFGTIVAQRKSEWHFAIGQDRDIFAGLLLDIHSTLAPALTILDGVWAMEGKGPGNGDPRHVGLIAASTDALALDLHIAGLLGAPGDLFPLGRAALSRGLIKGHHDTEIVGDDIPPVKDFVLPELGGVAMVPEPINRFLQRRAAPKPLQSPDLCQACGKCAEICPAGCITLDGRKASFDHNACIRCYCCHEVCPADAIFFKKGLLAKVLERLGR